MSRFTNAIDLDREQQPQRGSPLRAANSKSNPEQSEIHTKQTCIKWKWKHSGYIIFLVV
jgi:hypothetical protein